MTEQTADAKVEQGGAMVLADPLLAMIAAAANGDPANLEKLVALKERCDDRNAEMAFSIAMRSAQEEIKAIVRDAENSNSHSRYARLETIDRHIRPIVTTHGFSLSFNSGQPRQPGAIRVICDVRHVAGHTQQYELEGDLDTAGAKGTANKTSIQGLGSTVSYLRRYLKLMIFDVILTNEDNDGQGYIDDQQVSNIQDMIAACEMNPRATAAFFKLAGVQKIEELPRGRYDDIMEALRNKFEQKRRGQQ